MAARKTGIMIVGLAGNNGSSMLAASILAKRGKMDKMYGSLASVGTFPVSQYEPGAKPTYKSFKEVVPTLLQAQDLVIGGWDIRKMTMEEAMRNAEVLDKDVIDSIKDEANEVKVLPAPYYPTFLAENQRPTANNCLKGDIACFDHVKQIQDDIREFRDANKLDLVVVLYSGSTERYMEIDSRIHDSAHGLSAGLHEHNTEMSPSLLFAMAAMAEGCLFANAAPQNTITLGVVELAKEHSGYLCNSDLASGQTKMKQSMIEYFVHRGLRTKSISSFNGLGNQDGYQLQGRKQFRSKEISKSGVLDDTLEGNNILHPTNDVEHIVRIDYVKDFGDNKRALDVYRAETCFGKTLDMTILSDCPDTALAVPILFDIVIFGEFFTRRFPKHPILSSMGLFFKAPGGNGDEYIFNGFSVQRKVLENAILVSMGMPLVNIQAKL